VIARISVVTIFFLLAISGAFASVVHIPADYTTIQEGIDAALQGDTVMVSDGIFTGDGNRDIDPGGKVLLITSENGPDLCVIDCFDVSGKPHRGFYFHSGENRLTHLNGFTVINGDTENGGGLYLEESSPYISNCNVMNNSSDSNGGGLYLSNSSSTLDNCCISGNSAVSGGGIYCVNSQILINECNISGNLALEQGAGLTLQGTPATIMESAFTDNYAGTPESKGSGGGVYVDYTSINVTNCLFKGNKAFAGGAIALNRTGYDGRKQSICSCIFEDNQSVYGGAIKIDRLAYPEISGSSDSFNIFTGNRAYAGADLFVADNYNIVNARYNKFAGYHLSEFCVYPQDQFDLTGSISDIDPILQDVYVSELGDNSNDGLTPDTAFRTVYHALSHIYATDSTPLTIYILPGIYSPSNTGEIFPLPLLNNVSITGDDPEIVILDAERTDCVFAAYHDHLDLAGLTITGGINSGIRCFSSDLRVSNCIISQNVSEMGEASGGGVFARASKLNINKCVINDNAASKYGGGLYYAEEPRYSATATFLTISESDIRGNRADIKGGSLCCGDSTGSIEYGLKVNLINCLISDNISSGCCVYFYTRNFNLINCDLVNNNSSGSSAAGITIDHNDRYSDIAITNCILWGNGIEEISVNSSVNYLKVSHSCIQNGYPGENNIQTNPCFTDSIDYHLRSDSPCIDAGTDFEAPVFDNDGAFRPMGGRTDIGAFEYDGWPSVSRTYINIPDVDFGPGDLFSCKIDVWNAQAVPLNKYPLFVILDVQGTFFFAPGFNSFDYYMPDLPPGRTRVNVIPGFTWPSDAGSMNDLVWYAILTDPDITEIFGYVDTFKFSFHE